MADPSKGSGGVSRYKTKKLNQQQAEKEYLLFKRSRDHLDEDVQEIVNRKILSSPYNVICPIGITLKY